MKKTSNKNVLKTVGAVVGAVAIAGLGVAAGFALDNPTPVVKYLPGDVVYVNQTNPVNQDLVAENNALKEQVASFEPEVVTETVEVPVDNGNLQVVLDELYDLNGNVTFLTDDLDDDEVSLIVDRIVFLNDAETLAFNEVKDKVKDELDMYVFNSSVTFDDDEVYSVRMDFDDISLDLSSVDFDDSEVEVLVPASFKQDGVRYDAVFRVYIEDSEVDDVDVESVALH